MFKQVLYTQWRWSRAELFLFVLAGFVAPLIIVRVGVTVNDAYAATTMRTIGTYAGFFLIGLSFASACALAWRPYVVDASLRHVSALTLPVQWSSFVRMRFAAGALLLTLPAAAVLIGSVAAAASTMIPPTLHAYPVGISLRFLLTSLEIYSLAFLLQYVSGKYATRVAIGFILLVVASELVAISFGYDSFITAAWDFLTRSPGPFTTFDGAWRLFDV